MTPLIIGLVLFAALLHASWNAMAKSGGTPQFSIASYRLISAICCLPLLFFFPLPFAASWPMLLASTLIHTLYYYTLSKSYRSGDLSQVYPLFRGLAPVLVVLGAAVFASEFLSPGAMLGIGLVSLGLISITFAGGAIGKIPPLALRWGLATSVLIAAYTVADGIGVRAAGNPFSYILWLFVLEPIPIGLWLLVRDRSGWFSYWQPHADSELGMGIVVEPKYLEGYTEHLVDDKDQSHLLVHMKPIENSVVYYAGFGWSKSGRFNNQKEWVAYLADFGRGLESGLTYYISK